MVKKKDEKIWNDGRIEKNDKKNENGKWKWK